VGKGSEVRRNNSIVKKPKKEQSIWSAEMGTKKDETG
jgi:hypothetical protein